MAPRVFLFALRSDPVPRERLGACLPDGCIVDLQAGHFAMRGVPSTFLRDATAYRLGGDPARRAAAEVLAWVDSQRAPGTALKPDLARVVAELE